MIAAILNSGFEGTPISYSPRTDDVIALTLLACFFLSSIALARGKKFLTQQVKDFVLHRERTSIFDSSTAADVRYLLVLVVQTCVLTGIVFFNYFHDTCPMLMTRVSPLLPPPTALPQVVSADTQAVLPHPVLSVARDECQPNRRTTGTMRPLPATDS